MDAITVERLLQACKYQIGKGNGKKKVMLSGDDEGNSYHECFYLFSPEIKGQDIEYGLPIPTDEFDENYILLG